MISHLGHFIFFVPSTHLAKANIEGTKKTFIADAMKVLHLLLDPALSSVLTNLTLLSQLLLPFWAVPITYESAFPIVSFGNKDVLKNFENHQSVLMVFSHQATSP
jgi:hypothetical protein